MTNRRAFLKGQFFTRDGRRQLAQRYAEQGLETSGRVRIDRLSCLAWQRIACRACVDSCGQNAIVNASGFAPVVDETRCSGCADCVSVCPAGAVLPFA